VENNASYAVTVCESECGTVLSTTSAQEGQSVHVNIAPQQGYEASAIYVNGAKINGTTFTMPAEDVQVLVSFSSTSQSAHKVTVQNNSALGVIIADKESAEAGETVTLRSFVTYGNTLNAIFVNGNALNGNTFVMPDSDVEITAVYNNAISETSVVLTATQSYQTATSYWYASYLPTALQVEVVVEDNLIFTAGKTLADISQGDNIEFQFEVKSDETSAYNTYKMLVDAVGNFYFQRYTANGWSHVQGAVVQTKEYTLADSGFNGYKVSVQIPYSSFGTTYAKAKGNVTIAPAMRNTLNPLKTTWTSYTEMFCRWDDAKSHLLIAEDGTFTANPFMTDCLFVGDKTLMVENWTNFYSNVGFLNDVYSMACEEGSVVYWTEHLDAISQKARSVVYLFSGDLCADQTAISAFQQMQKFITAFQTEMPTLSLHIISAIPSVHNTEELARTEAFNAMLQDYADTLSGVTYLDLYTPLMQNGEVNPNLYTLDAGLSEEGYLLLSSLLGYSSSSVGQSWGTNGAYVSTTGWGGSQTTMTLSEGGTRNIYYRGTLDSTFTFSASVTATTIYNSDSYPKFGFTLYTDSVAYYFFIYGDNNLTNQTAGMVIREYGVYDWDNATEVAVPNLAYKGGNTATIKLIVSGQTVAYYVNDTLIYRGQMQSKTQGKGGLTLGLFSFNTGLRISNMAYSLQGE
jgi:hypothetical protein